MKAKKPRRGRPPLPPEQRDFRPRALTIRLHEAEVQAIARAANNAHEPMAAWIRRVALERASEQ